MKVGDGVVVAVAFGVGEGGISVGEGGIGVGRTGVAVGGTGVALGNIAVIVGCGVSVGAQATNALRSKQQPATQKFRKLSVLKGCVMVHIPGRSDDGYKKRPA